MSKFLSRFQRGDTKEVDNTKAIKELKDGDTGLPFDIEHSALAAGLDLLKDPNAVDDRKLLLEKILVKLSEFPKGSLQKRLEQNDLPHPPLTNVGDQYAWRSADGSGNSMVDPELGKAGNPYARSVSQSRPLARHQLPDAGLVFDTLLRREKFEPHPAGLSSLMFSFAALVIHSVFRTNHDNVNINETSSYVDLAPLYGVNQEKQNEVRVRDGRGKLHPDVFSEDRLLLLPPAVCVLLVLFNRNHNYIAQKLLEINERGTWKDPDTIPADTPNRSDIFIQQEEEIFQTARLINCGWFGFVVFSDYFSAILGLVRQGNTWSLDPFSEFRREDHAIFERGRGNVCSVEFNCLYRWHATTSKEDERWVEQSTTHHFPGKKSDEITVSEFKGKLKEIQQGETSITTWTFGGIKRNITDGKFRNEDLANILKAQTEHPAGAFGARGTPANMRWMEVMGIEAARRWGCCSLNDFRKYLGLKPHKTFLEWNPNEEIAAAAEKLYGTIDNLELYAGLQAEATKPVVKGAGLCPGYTISRAILADAIALIRGDRLFTADFTPHNLTAWGFADCVRSPENPGFGSMLGRLFLRTLPDEYTENSTYAWFPLMTPKAMDEILTEIGGKEKYDFVRPESSHGPRGFKEYGEVTGILGNKEKFRHPFLSRVSKVIRGPGFFLATDAPERGEREQRQLFKALAETSEQADAITKFFYDTTKALIAKQSYKFIGVERSALDIVRDVFRVVPVQWVATQVAGITLKKPEDDIENAFTETELFDALSDIYAYCFLDIEAGQILKTQNRVETGIKRVMDHIEANVGGSIVKRLSVSGFVGTLSRMFGNKQDLAERLQQSGNSTSQNANSILAVMVGASVELTQALTHMLNILLDQTDVAQALVTTDKADVLEGYVTEMLRVDPPVPGIYREAKADETVGSTSISTGDLVYLDIASASLNERAFAQPSTIDHSRPKEHYIRGDILTRTLGTEVVSKIVVKVLQAVFELKNVARGPGQSGELKRFVCEVEGIKSYRYLDKDQKLSPWASSLVITYDN
ncbi:heme peroxidase [Thelephora ganbajun]|uniref:Heme peroxidase n=1 Tax=Thelephora ganbajun TaxID=370292 RepID=A0ACB6ZM89_THEGA|nr:heme peroxidase [Thelephora ganbajun]